MRFHLSQAIDVRFHVHTTAVGILTPERVSSVGVWEVTHTFHWGRTIMGSLPCGCYLLTRLTRYQKRSKEFMVLRDRPAPTRIPTNIPWTLVSSTSMHFISSDAWRFISLTTDIQLTLIKKTLNYLKTTFFTLFKALGHYELPVCWQSGLSRLQVALFYDRPIVTLIWFLFFFFFASFNVKTNTWLRRYRKSSA